MRPTTMGMNLRSRFLAFGIVAPIALFLLLNASLRIVFGLALSLLVRRRRAWRSRYPSWSNPDWRVGEFGIEEQSGSRHWMPIVSVDATDMGAVCSGYRIRSGHVRRIRSAPCDKRYCPCERLPATILTSVSGAMILICCLYVILQVGHSKTDTTIHLQLLATCFCTWYIGCNIGYAALLNKQQWALDVLIYVIVVIGVGETGALFGGAVFGRHRVSWISPGKTLEGYVAAVLTGVLASLAFDSLHGFFFPGTAGLVISFVAVIDRCAVASKFPLVGSRSIALPCVISIAGSLGALYSFRCSSDPNPLHR